MIENEPISKIRYNGVEIPLGSVSYVSTEPMWFYVWSNSVCSASAVGLNGGDFTNVKLPTSYVDGGKHCVPFRVTPSNLNFMAARLEPIGYDFFFFVKNETTGDYTVVFEVKSATDFNNMAGYLQREISNKGYVDVFLNETMALRGDNIPLDSIWTRAFKDSTQLNGSLTIPSSYKIIGSQAFYNCTMLTSLILNEGLETIGSAAFNGCTGLAGELVLPSTIKTIEATAFYGCRGITSITLKATTPPTLSDVSAIPDSVTKIYIPEGTLGAYRTAENWSNFADIFDDGTLPPDDTGPDDTEGDDFESGGEWNDGWDGDLVW